MRLRAGVPEHPGGDRRLGPRRPGAGRGARPGPRSALPGHAHRVASRRVVEVHRRPVRGDDAHAGGADAAAERTIAAARARAGDEIPVTTVVGRGSTAEAILARAREGEPRPDRDGLPRPRRGRLGAPGEREPPRPPSRPRPGPDRARRPDDEAASARVGSAAVAAPALRRHHHGPDRGGHLPAERRPARGRDRVLALARRDGDERRGRRRPARPRIAVITKVGDDPFGRYAVARARRVRGRHRAS